MVPYVPCGLLGAIASPLQHCERPSACRHRKARVLTPRGIASRPGRHRQVCRAPRPGADATHPTWVHRCRPLHISHGSAKLSLRGQCFAPAFNGIGPVRTALVRRAVFLDCWARRPPDARRVALDVTPPECQQKTNFGRTLSRRLLACRGLRYQSLEPRIARSAENRTPGAIVCGSSPAPGRDLRFWLVLHLGKNVGNCTRFPRGSPRLSQHTAVQFFRVRYVAAVALVREHRVHAKLRVGHLK